MKTRSQNWKKQVCFLACLLLTVSLNQETISPLLNEAFFVESIQNGTDLDKSPLESLLELRELGLLYLSHIC